MLSYHKTYLSKLILHFDGNLLLAFAYLIAILPLSIYIALVTPACIIKNIEAISVFSKFYENKMCHKGCCRVCFQYYTSKKDKPNLNTYALKALYMIVWIDF